MAYEHGGTHATRMAFLLQEGASIHYSDTLIPRAGR
jgi:hypothetical protein